MPYLSKIRLCPVVLAAFLMSCVDAKPLTAPDAGTDSLQLQMRRSTGIPLINTQGEATDLPPFLNRASPAGSGVRASMSTSQTSSSLSTAMVPAPTIFWHSTSGEAKLWRMNGTSFTGESSAAGTLASPWRLAAAADLNADGETDMIWENTTDGWRLVAFMNGPSYAGSYKAFLSLAPVWRITAAADFNADGKPDLVVENSTTGEHHILLMNGATYTGTLVATIQLPPNYQVFAAADMTGDGKPDLVWQNVSDGMVFVTHMNGTTYVGTYTILGTVPVAQRLSGAADFNGDGRADLVFQNAQDGQSRLYLLQGLALPSQFTQFQGLASSRLASAASVRWSTVVEGPPDKVAELRAAIANAAPNTRVTIPAGVYDIGNTPIRVEGRQNVEIFGAGRGQTIIRAGASAPFVIELAGNNDNIRIAHLTIEGATTLAINTHGLASGFNRLSLRGARFFDLDVRNVAVGISVVGTGPSVCNDIGITGNYLENIQGFLKSDGSASGSGYGIHNDGCTQTRIADNTIRNADRHSIYQAGGYQPDRTGPGSIVIERNLIVDHARTSALNSHWQVAIAVARSSNVVVAHNVIVNPYQDAMSIEDPPAEGKTYVVRDVRLIGNTVLGSRAADVYLTAAGSFTSWGNRFYHSDALAAPSTPSVLREGAGVSGNLVEPAGYAGTQAMGSFTPNSTVTVMQANKISRATTAYNSDPAGWAAERSPVVWSGFEDLAVSASHIYVMMSRRLVEIDPVAQTWRMAAHVFPSRSVIVPAQGLIVAASGTQLIRVNASTLESAASPTPGSGQVRGMASYGGRLYLYAGNCHYEVNASTLAATTIGC